MCFSCPHPPDLKSWIWPCQQNFTYHKLSTPDRLKNQASQSTSMWHLRLKKCSICAFLNFLLQFLVYFWKKKNTCTYDIMHLYHSKILDKLWEKVNGLKQAQYLSLTCYAVPFLHNPLKEGTISLSLQTCDIYGRIFTHIEKETASIHTIISSLNDQLIKTCKKFVYLIEI